MQREEIKLKGTSPLMVHAELLSNPLSPLKKEIAEFTSKRKKTDDDWAQIFRIEWEGGLYFKDVPIMPGNAIKATIRSSAKLSRRGRHIQRGVQILEPEVPLEYNGPKSKDRMWDSGNYHDIRSVVVQGSRVMRCRPIFREWALTFTLLVNETIMDMQEVLDIIRLGGEIEGLCENRMNGYGRYEIV